MFSDTQKDPQIQLLKTCATCGQSLGHQMGPQSIVCLPEDCSDCVRMRKMAELVADRILQALDRRV